MATKGEITPNVSIRCTRFYFNPQMKLKSLEIFWKLHYSFFFFFFLVISISAISISKAFTQLI